MTDTLATLSPHDTRAARPRPAPRRLLAKLLQLPHRQRIRPCLITADFAARATTKTT